MGGNTLWDSLISTKSHGNAFYDWPYSPLHEIIKIHLWKYWRKLIFTCMLFCQLIKRIKPLWHLKISIPNDSYVTKFLEIKIQFNLFRYLRKHLSGRRSVDLELRNQANCLTFFSFAKWNGLNCIIWGPVQLSNPLM